MMVTLPDAQEQARRDMSKLLDGYVQKRLQKREAMQLVDGMFDRVRRLGYDEGYYEGYRDGHEDGLCESY